MREVELKLAADGGFVVPPLDQNGTVVTRSEELPAQDLRAVYYDTNDLRLARHGITLRHRSGDGDPVWTLKLPISSDSVAVREELSFTGSSSDIPEDTKSLVTAFVRGAGLAPVARLSTRRRRWLLFDENGGEIAELVDDEVSVLEGSEVVARFRELEIESRGAEPAQLRSVATLLEGAGARTAEPIPKAVRALGARATAPPDIPPPLPLAPEEPARTAVQAALAKGLARVMEHDPAVRLGDVEALHQMRVGTRRMRSDLGTFEPLVHPYWADDLVSELRWLGDVLGGVRDVDVFRERLEEEMPDLTEDLQPLYEALHERHVDARARLMEALNGERYIRLLDSLVAVTRLPHTTGEGDRASSDVLPPLAAAAWSSLAKRARRLSATAPPEAFHKVRIRAKRLRYASEAIAPALGETEGDAKRLAKAVAGVQDLLGDHQDCYVAIATIQEVAAARPDDGMFNLAAGRAIERELHKAEGCRSEFTRVWGRLDRKKWRKWFKG